MIFGGSTDPLNLFALKTSLIIGGDDMIYIMLLVAIGFGLCLGYYVGVFAIIIGYTKNRIRIIEILEESAERMKEITKHF